MEIVQLIANANAAKSLKGREPWVLTLSPRSAGQAPSNCSGTFSSPSVMCDCPENAHQSEPLRERCGAGGWKEQMEDGEPVRIS